MLVYVTFLLATFFKYVLHLAIITYSLKVAASSLVENNIKVNSKSLYSLCYNIVTFRDDNVVNFGRHYLILLILENFYFLGLFVSEIRMFLFLQKWSHRIAEATTKNVFKFFARVFFDECFDDGVSKAEKSI